jgi:ubiquinone biosynthesis protein COQ4
MADGSFDIPRAARAAALLSQDPDDTRHVFTLIEALSGDTNGRLVAGFRADAEGRRLLDEQPDLLALLCDRERLAATPEGSLGRAYLAFVDAEGITADGLVAASKQGQKGLHAPGSWGAYVSQRMRDTHDLWHTVTGYKGDLIGEVSLLAFSNAQIWNPGISVIVGVGIFRIRELRVARSILGGRVRGTRAAWLPAVRWEALLAMPLERVRARLGVRPVAPYVEMRSSELRAQGALAPRAA